jgi:hypothetical protein
MTVFVVYDQHNEVIIAVCATEELANKHEGIGTYIEEWEVEA